MWDHFSDILRKAVNIQNGTDIKGTASAAVLISKATTSGFSPVELFSHQ